MRKATHFVDGDVFSCYLRISSPYDYDCVKLNVRRTTLKAFANSSPGLLQPWDSGSNPMLLANSEGVREVAHEQLANAFSVTIS